MAPEIRKIVDLYGVNGDREGLLEKARGPYFATWWEGFLARLRERAEQPAYLEIPGLGEMDAASTYQARHTRLIDASRDMHASSFAYALTSDDRYAALARDIAEKARAESDKLLADSKSKLETESNRIRGEVKVIIPGLARQIASKLLDREVR